MQRGRIERFPYYMDFGIGLNILEAIYKAVKQLKEVGYNSEQVQRLHFQLTYMIEIITGKCIHFKKNDGSVTLCQ